jgi:hypothetical protein
MVVLWDGEVVADLCEGVSTPSRSVLRGGVVVRVITVGVCRLEPIPEVRRSTAGGEVARNVSMPSASGFGSGSLSAGKNMDIAAID